MRLARIVAERFGRLESIGLGELGQELTVVLGPNEAGKTSFTSLVRHVLYGFPTKRDSETGYESATGKRLARLVFAENGGQWAIERTEGPHGGPVAVSALGGAERNDILASVTRGVSRDAFRVVFGFGIDEMAQIEVGRGTGDNILSRLYAAGAGLAVSPQDVRAGLDDEAGELWRKGGSKPALNALKTQITAVKKELSEIEATASRFAEEQARLLDLSARSEHARVTRERTASRHNELSSAAGRLADLERRVTELATQVQTDHEELVIATERLDRIVFDERVIGAGAELDSILGDLSGFRERLRRIAEQQSEIASLESRSRAALARAGVDESVAATADLGPETEAGIETWRERLTTLTSQATVSRRAAINAQAALETASGQAGDERPRGAIGLGAAWVPGAVMIAAAALVAAAGVFARQPVQIGLGAALLMVGALFVFRAVRPRRRAEQTGPTAQAVSQSGASSMAAERDEAELRAAKAEWTQWLESRGLSSAGDDPKAVTLLHAALKEHRDLRAEAARVARLRDGDEAACVAFRDRLSGIASPFLGDTSQTPLDAVVALASRCRDAVDRAREQHAERVALEEAIDRGAVMLAGATGRLEVLRAEVAEIGETVGIPGADSARLASEVRDARESAAAADRAYDEIAREHASVSARLDSEGRDAEMARRRLELTGLEQRREEALERHAVLAVASQLMARTQAFNERERQPEVIRRASELFERITEGRYVRVNVPSDGGDFEVFDADSGRWPSSRLSTGTAQQLYLAMRIALIETLEGVGEGLPVLMDDVLVNFDPARKRGAAEAIVHLAARRQVVLFTCHPETAALMDEVAPGHTTLSLDRC